MKKLSAKEQIILVLCHKLDRRQSMEIGNWVIELDRIDVGHMHICYFEGKNISYKRTGSTYSRKWRLLREINYFKWYYKKYAPWHRENKSVSMQVVHDFSVDYETTLPKFNYTTNTWHLPRQFCKFLRHERDRILRRFR